MKKMMAVYDADTRYAERLSDYVNRKEKGVFIAQVFTSKEKLAEYAKKHEIDVLLSGERTDSGDISGIPSAQKIYMSEETEKQMDSGKEIYKFQSGDDIIREVMAVYSEIPGIRPNTAGATDQSRRIIGVYSPIGRCGKTCLALAIGQILAKEEKVLFVTLDTFTGFTGLLNERWKRDLSDLIYYYKQDRFHVVRLNSSSIIWGTWRGSRRSAFHRTIRSCRCRRWRIFWNGSCRKEIIRRWFSMWGITGGMRCRYWKNAR